MNTLPNEIVRVITSHLLPRDMYAFRQTSIRMRDNVEIYIGNCNVYTFREELHRIKLARKIRDIVKSPIDKENTLYKRYVRTGHILDRNVTAVWWLSLFPKFTKYSMMCDQDDAEYEKGTEAFLNFWGYSVPVFMYRNRWDEFYITYGCMNDHDVDTERSYTKIKACLPCWVIDELLTSK